MTTIPNRHDVWTFVVHDDLYYINTDERQNMRDAQYEQDSPLALEAPFLPEEPFWSKFRFVIDKSYAKGELVLLRDCLKVTGTQQQLNAGGDTDVYR